MYLVFKQTPTNHVHFYGVSRDLVKAEKYVKEIKDMETREYNRVHEPYPYFGRYLKEICIMKVKEV